MAKYKQPFYHAFRIEYSGVARDLRSQAGILLPSATHPDFSKKAKIDFIGLWDTGATGTVISKSVVNKVGLTATGQKEVRGVTGAATRDVYMVDIVLPNNLLLANVEVVDGDIPCDVLIGMNIISLGDFLITNFSQKTTFSFCMPPHNNRLDLLDKSDAVNKISKSKPANKIK